MSKLFNKRFLSGFLALLMLLTMMPSAIFADGADEALSYNVTKDVTSLLTSVELEGATRGEDGKYYVDANQAFSIKLTISENSALEMDMSDSIYFELPAGVVATSENNVIDIGVVDGFYKSIFHKYTIDDGKMTITWNKDSEFFEDLARAHFVEFSFYINAKFDGSQDTVTFGDFVEATVEVDSTGSITIGKTISGLGADVNLTEKDKRAMTFELRDASGKAVKVFTYADLENGAITFHNMEPGKYTVVETGHPDFPNYNFDADDSVITLTDTLKNGGTLNFGLSNDYEYQTGTLVLNKSVDCFNWDGSKNVPDSVKAGISFTIKGPGGYYATASYLNDFVNGKLKLTGLKVGEYTITEHNSVAGYEWDYTINNKSSVTPSATVQITDGKTSTVDFKNTYKQKTADLTIKKTAAGASVPAGAEFRVTFPDGSHKTIKYSDMVRGEYTFENVPLGTYTVKEVRNSAVVANYALTVTGEGRVTLAEGDQKTVSIHNAYAPYGAIKINKTVTGDLNKDSMDYAQKSAIVFGVYDAQGKLVATRTYADILSGNHTIGELPVGRYTVKETSWEIPGYTVVTGNKEVAVNVSVGQTGNASFTNNYTKKTYILTVNKAFGADSAFNASNLPDALKKGTTFAVSQNGRVLFSCTYEELAQKLTNLSLSGPGPYVVTEINPDVPGVSVSTQVSSDGTNFRDANSIEITLQNQVPATVTFKNNYSLWGTIKVDKTVSGLTSYYEEDLRGKITFSIYYENGELYRENVSLSQLESGIAVPVGRYYIKETGSLGVAGYNGPTVTSQVGNGAVKDGDTSNTFGVGQNAVASVHFTNHYTEGEKGRFGLTKNTKGIGGASGTSQLTQGDLYDTITFTLEEKKGDSWYVFGTYSLDQLVKGIELRPGRYRLTEQNADLSGHSHKIELEGMGTLKNGKIEFTITEDQRTSVTVTNVYTPLGNLKVTKTIAGTIAMTEAERKAVVFTVTGPNNYHATFNLNDIYNSKTGRYEKTIKNLPAGEYTVVETAGNTSQYTVVQTSNLTNNKVTISLSQTSVAAFTNTYTRMTGDLTVKKVMAGEAPVNMTQEQMKTMKFIVKSGSLEVVSATYDQFVDGKYTFTDLPTGTYTVIEQIGETITDSYRVDITGSGSNVQVTNNGNAELVITNTFAKTGSLKLTKHFAGCAIPDSLKNTVKFEYYRVNDNGAVVGEVKTVSYSDFTDGICVIKNLLPGKYVVSELFNATDYLRSTTVSVNGGEQTSTTTAKVDIAFGTTDEVYFKNTYTEVASLVITKTIAGDLTNMTDEQRKAIRFTVTDEEGEAVCDPFTYYEMVGGTRAIYNLRAGVYTVTEEITKPELFNGYVCVSEYKVGTGETIKGTAAEITAGHGANNVAFTNTYSTIDHLKVEKYSSMTYVGLVEKEGLQFPVWKFELNISNLNPLTTKNGTTEMTDKFDTTYSHWFRFATAQELSKLEGAPQNAVLSSLVAGKAAPDIEAVETSGQVNIRIFNITDNTADKCRFTYYLIPADASVLSQMNASDNVESAAVEDNTHSNGVSHHFTNTVSYNLMPYLDEVLIVNADYKYEFTAIGKMLSNIDEEGNLFDVIDGEKHIVNYADYSVTINPSGISIGDQPTIIAIDQFSENQTVLLSSIKTSPSENVTYTLDNNTRQLVFTIPNATPVTISYRSIITGGGDSDITLSNEITLQGFVDKVEAQAQRAMGGAGQGTIYSINLMKVDALDNSRKLEGIKFSLYDGETDVLLTSAETDKEGKIAFKYWGNNGSFVLDQEYYLVEHGAATGYHAKTAPVRFRISEKDNPGVDTDGVNILNNGGELIVSNEPITATLEVTKQYNNWTDQDRFMFELQPVDGAPMPTDGVNTAFATEKDPTVTFGPIRFDVDGETLSEGGAVTYRYTIREVVQTMLDGVKYDTSEHAVTVVITDSNKDGVKEIAVSYDNNQPGLTITNTYELVEVSGSKDWQDDNDRDRKRPEMIIVNLLADGERIERRIITEDDNWSWSFTDLPKYVNGEEVDYDVTEETVDGYTTTYDGYNVINSYTPEKTEISVAKKWEDASDQDRIRPQAIEVMLLADGEETGLTLELNSDNNWTGKFTDLYKYNAGQEIVYTVKEAVVPEDYTESVEGTAEDGFVITNTHEPEKTEVPVTKVWDDADDQDRVRPLAITVVLLADGEETDMTLELNSDNNWTGAFTELDKYKAGVEIVYTVKEAEVPEGYVESVTGSQEQGHVITNTHEPEKVGIKVTKVWDDKNNVDKIRPNKIEVMLLANGEETGLILELNAENDWTAEFPDLDKYNAGEEIVYTVKEVNVPDGYTALVGGTADGSYVITNTHVPEEPPKTGDEDNVLLWQMLMLASGAAFTALIAARKKKWAE